MKTQKYKDHYLNFTATLCHTVTENHSNMADIGSQSNLGGKNRKQGTPAATHVAVPQVVPVRLSPCLMVKRKTPS